MPMNPLQSQVHIDQLLTPVLISYRNPTHIADEIFSAVPVRKRSDIIPKFDQSPWFRDEAEVRAPGTKSSGGGFTTDSTQKYYCDRVSFRYEADDETADNVDQPYDLERAGIMFVGGKISLRKERAFATKWFTTSKWGTDKVGTTDFVKWSDYGGSTPLLDLAVWQEAVEAKVGLEPAHAALGRAILTYLKWHPDLVDTIKYTAVGKVTTDTILSLTDLTQLLVGRALVTTSPKGTAEASVTYTRVWGPHLLLYYRPPAPALNEPAAGYNFTWARVPGSLYYVKRMRDEEREVDILEGNAYFAQEQTAKNAGLFAQNVV